MKRAYRHAEGGTAIDYPAIIAVVAVFAFIAGYIACAYFTAPDRPRV